MRDGDHAQDLFDHVRVVRAEGGLELGCEIKVGFGADFPRKWMEPLGLFGAWKWHVPI